MSGGSLSGLYAGTGVVITTGTGWTATIAIGQSVDITATVTFTNVVLNPGGYIEFTKNTGVDAGDRGLHQYKRAPVHINNYTDLTKYPPNSYQPGDTYYDDLGDSYSLLCEVSPPVLDLPVNGNLGDIFLTAVNITTPANTFPGIVPLMDVYGDGIDAFTTVDPVTPHVFDPVTSLYTINLNQPLIGTVTTASFTLWVWKDITSK